MLGLSRLPSRTMEFVSELGDGTIEPFADHPSNKRNLLLSNQHALRGTPRGSTAPGPRIRQLTVNRVAQQLRRLRARRPCRHGNAQMSRIAPQCTVWQNVD